MTTRVVPFAFAICLFAACQSRPADDDASAGDSAAVTTAAADSSVASGPKACDLVSAAELSRVTALELEEGRLTNDYGGVSQCRWSRAGGTDNGVAISLREQGDMAIYTSVPGSAPVQGLGDEAVWNQTTKQLAVRSGQRIASVTFLYPEGREQQARDIVIILLSKIR